MNFADAIRQAAKNAANSGAPQPVYEVPDLGQPKEQNNVNSEPHFQPINDALGSAPATEASAIAFDAVTAEPVNLPQRPLEVVGTGNVVRLELFLSPEQMNQLFRSLVATQHAMYTLREAAQYLRVSPATVEAMATEGRLPGLLIENRWRFPKSALDEWLSVEVFRKGEHDAA